MQARPRIQSIQASRCATGAAIAVKGRSDGFMASLVRVHGSCGLLLHPIQNRADDASDDASFGGFAGWSWHVFHELVRQLRNRKSLKPDAARAVSEARKIPSPPKIMFLIPGTVVIWNGDVGLECADVARMDAQGFSRLKILDDEFAGEFEPRCTQSAEAL